jgi:cytochrome c peroxidase
VGKRPVRQRPDRSRPHALRLIVAAALLAGASAAAAGDLTVPLPGHVLPPLAPETSGALTTEKVELGKKLYFERRLSADDSVSCATCHDPRHGFAEPKPVSIGVGGKKGVRNAPSAFDAAFLGTQFWDGRVPTLEEQATGPIVNPIEMAMPSSDAAVAKIAALAEYKPLFEGAFGDEAVTMDRIAIAIASFERTLVDVEAPIDRFVAGDQNAISASARRGWDLYNGKARCNNCHGYVASFPLMTDELFHNIGVAAKDVNFEQLARHVSANPDSFTDLAHTEGVTELGRFIVTKEYKDIGAFKTPQLRNVALTPPYMHNGSEATLEAVIDFYDKGGNPNPWLDGGMRPLSLTAQEKADLVEVMKTFTSDGMARFAPLAELMPR